MRVERYEGGLLVTYRHFLITQRYSEITEDLVVYLFSKPIFLSDLEKKADRLSKSGAVEKSSVLLRELAKDGLMDDGKEKLLESKSVVLAREVVVDNRCSCFLRRKAKIGLRSDLAVYSNTIAPRVTFEV